MIKNNIEVEEEILTEVIEKKGKKLYLHNDDVSSFELVILSLMKVCGHSSTQAEQIATIVHYKGVCAVKENTEDDKLKLMKEKLQSVGLTVTIE